MKVQTIRAISSKMEYELEVINGIECEILAKGAFMEKIAGYQYKGENLLLKMILDHKELRNKYIDGSAVQALSFGEEELEEMFDMVLHERKLDDLGMNAGSRLYSMPLEYDHEILKVDTMGYLVYGILKNERCMEKLRECIAENEQIFYTEYKESPYCENMILDLFLQKDKSMACLLIGLICKVRQQKSSEYHEMLMKILYSGYRSYKNQIEIADRINSKNLSDIFCREKVLMMGCAKVVIYLAIAEEFQKNVVRDYDFYYLIYCLWYHDTNIKKEETNISLSENGKKYKKKMKRICNLRFYYENSADIDQDIFDRETEVDANFWDRENKTVLESIFELFHLNIAAFDDYGLNEEEVNGLCEILAKEGADKDEYNRKLLISTLCKYVKELERLCSENSKEEQGYRILEDERSRFHKAIKALDDEKQHLNQVNEQLSGQLEDFEKENKKMREKIKKMESDKGAERQELIALRNYIYQKRHEEDEIFNEKDKLQKEQCLLSGKVIVVGGHPSWQSRMKEKFTDAVFLEADNLNFDTATVKDADYIIMNTGALTHACYYRVLSQKNDSTQILFVENRNMDLCMKELLMQIS